MGNILIVCLLLIAPDDPRTELRPSVAVRFQAIRREQETLLREHRESSRSAKTADERAAHAGLYQSRLNNLTERALQLARTNPKDDDAIAILGWVIRTQRGGRNLARAIETLLKDHINDPKLVEACRDVGQTPPNSFETASAFLRDVLENSPCHDVRGVAAFNLADRVRERAELVSRMEEHPEEVDRIQAAFNFSPESLVRFRARPAWALSRDAEELYEHVLTHFAEIPSRARSLTIGKLAEARLFQIHHLATGCTAPEISAKDLDGKELKLSEFRGKIVVLIFSGTWSQPSRRLYSHERELVDRLKDKPFALLGFNAERDTTALRKSIDSGEITWRCWREAGPSSPTLLKWGINRYPTIFVIDAEGKIRHRAPLADQLDIIVDALLMEQEAAPKPIDSRD